MGTMIKSLAVGGTIAIGDVAMFNRDLRDAAIDGACGGGAAFVADLIFSPTSGVGGKYSGLANSGVGAALYVGANAMLDKAPFDGMFANAAYYIGANCVGTNVVLQLINGVNFSDTM